MGYLWLDHFVRAALGAQTETNQGRSVRSYKLSQNIIVPNVIALIKDLTMVPSPVTEGLLLHDDVIKWKHIPHYWSFVWGIYMSPVNSPHKGQWRGALIFFWSGPDHTAGDLRRHGPHFDVIVMFPIISSILGKPLKAGMCWIFHPVTDHKRFVS